MSGFGYHRFMRRCLYILLILLLPLRGWIGDAMAMQMVVASTGPHAVAAAGDAHHDVAGAPAHAHLSSAGAQASAGACDGHGIVNDPVNADEDSHCGECALCQTCHTVAVLSVGGIADAGLQRPTVPGPVIPGFTSADRARVLKPPTA